MRTENEGTHTEDMNQSHGDCLLEVDNLVVGYGEQGGHGHKVIDGISLSVRSDEAVALIGPNGCGKSTLVKACYGLLNPWEGRICVNGADVSEMSPPELVSEGLIYLPQGTCIFPTLTVRENLDVFASAVRRKGASAEMTERAIDFFPSLENRLNEQAGVLSGGERQLLALSRVPMLQPTMALLDEPSQGLAPEIVPELFEHLGRLRSEYDVGLLIIEHKLEELKPLVTCAYAIRLGELIGRKDSKPLLEDEALLNEIYGYA